MPGDVGVGIYDGAAGLDTIETFPSRVAGLSNRSALSSCRTAAVSTKLPFTNVAGMATTGNNRPLVKTVNCTFCMVTATTELIQ